jgi:hypothetical protein
MHCSKKAPSRTECWVRSLAQVCGEGVGQTTTGGFGGEPSAFCESECLREVCTSIATLYGDRMD